MAARSPSVSITRRSAGAAVSDADLRTAACVALPASYELSVVLCGDTRMHTLNRTYRDKDRPTNVLSFPLSDTAGEVFLNMAQIGREAAQYGHSPRKHAVYLFIHGCLHLKGYSHGSTMEKAEQKLLERCNIR
jgi:probable rRNA maturation factor